MRFVMSSRNSLSRAALIGLTLGVVALSGCGQGEQAASQAQAQAQAPAPEVTVVTMKAEPVTLTRELPGRTAASLVAEVRPQVSRSEEHTSELQSREKLVCRLLLEKKKKLI